jgi:tetratricopeptide (TPR) repeat protein
MKRLLSVLALAATCALAGRADTIVLKNGRRIPAAAVEERGDKVFYETPDGLFGIARSLVERIERDDRTPDWSAARAAFAADDLPALGDADVRRVVAGGQVNRDLLAEFDRAAERAGTDAARVRAAAAYALVAQTFLERGDTAAAMDAYRRSLSYAPRHPGLLVSLASLEYEQERYAAALEHLQPVFLQSRYLFEAYRLQGWIYYRTDDLDRALTAWTRAIAARRDPELEAWVAQAEREDRAAADFQQRESGRFVLRYDGGEAPARVAAGILDALDSMFNDMTSAFNVLPREPIVVILYPHETFYNLTGMPLEVHGLYDGKIRVPVAGLTELTPSFRQVLRHELVHAFVFLKSRGRAPRWLQEGLAQWHAGQRPPLSMSFFAPLFEPRDGSALDRIEAAFGGEAGEVASAYAAAWLVVNTLEDRYSAGDMERFLVALGRGDGVEAALRSAFRLSFEDLDREVYASLR